MISEPLPVARNRLFGELSQAKTSSVIPDR